tara:strand:+ start:597 stop:1109 length:513 start_codon:yes stop_codon:yes gene_type:complete
MTEENKTPVRYHIHDVLKMHERRLRKVEKDTTSDSGENAQNFKSQFSNLNEQLTTLKASFETNKKESSNRLSECENTNNLSEVKLNTLKDNINNLEKKFNEFKVTFDKSNVYNKLEDILKNTSTFCEQMLRMDAGNAILLKRLDTLEKKLNDDEMQSEEKLDDDVKAVEG